MKAVKFLLYVLVVGLLLALAGSVGLGLAQGPEPPEGEVQPQGEVSIAATVGSKFSYQGVLKESGSPVTGSRDMTFRLYSDDTCSTQVGSDIVESGVQVTDGLFSVELDVTHGDFNGQGLWLEVEVGGTKIGCQEILPVPYALSLRPGATIKDTKSAVRLNYYETNNKYGVKATVGAIIGGGYSYGVHGSGYNYGVYGQSSSTSGLGGSFYNSTDGVALRAENNSAYSDPIFEIWNLGDREFYVESAGRVYADLGYYTPASDFAEMLPAGEGLEPGDVLVVGSDGKLTRSTQPYQASVVGVYSTKPGFVGGAGDDTDLTGKVPLAVIGVVPVKVTAENGPIRPGDLLVASSIPGHAMKAAPNPAVGTVIGKALEGLDEGTGVIQMLVILQ